ncbi:MAG: hypothetical protein P1U34_09150 [Coxiellaceae bacterium]|nr:hypothetical protein [Coxiellaceae bacterium]
MRPRKPSVEGKSQEQDSERFLSENFVDRLRHKQLVMLYSDGIDILHYGYLNGKERFNEYFRCLEQEKSIVTDLYLAMLYMPGGARSTLYGSDFGQETDYMSAENWPAIDDSKGVNVKSLSASKSYLERFRQRLEQRFPTVDDTFFTQRVKAFNVFHERVSVRRQLAFSLERSASAAPRTHYSPRLQAVATTQSDSELLASDSDSASVPSPTLFK